MTTTTSNPVLDYGRLPTGLEVVDNRKCWDYVFEKKLVGTYNTETQKIEPDHRSISALWTEARATYTNASETPSSKFNNPEINGDLLTWT